MLEPEPHEPMAYCDCRECALVERDRLRTEMRMITRIAPLGVPTYPEVYRRIQEIAKAALDRLTPDEEGQRT